jgi:hypothetical protein
VGPSRGVAAAAQAARNAFPYGRDGKATDAISGSLDVHNRQARAEHRTLTTS